VVIPLPEVGRPVKREPRNAQEPARTAGD